MNSPEKTLIIGLNPALERFIEVPNFHVGVVNKGSKLQVGIGGEGQNAIVTYKCLRSEPNPTLLQFLGQGFEGNTLLSMLESHTDSIISVRTRAKCRLSIILLNGDQTTEIIEPTDNLEVAEIQEMLQLVDKEYPHVKPNCIAVMGSLPKNCPENYYSQLLERLVTEESIVLIDTKNDVMTSILTIFNHGGQCILKVNVKEIFILVGKEYQGEHSNDEIQEMVNRFSRNLAREAWGLTSNLYIALTYGSRPSHFFQIAFAESDITSFNHWIVYVPLLDREVVSPIGAGDTTSAAMLYYLSTYAEKDRIQDAMLDAFRWGLACGTSSVYTTLNSSFSFDEVNAIFSDVKAERL
jgi:1-phosphofructokinase